MRRERINLTQEEQEIFERFNQPPFVVGPNAERVWTFWKGVTKRRGLDYTSLNGLTALPLDHGKHWCWPSSFTLKNRPVIAEFPMHGEAVRGGSA